MGGLPDERRRSSSPVWSRGATWRSATCGSTARSRTPGCGTWASWTCPGSASSPRGPTSTTSTACRTRSTSCCWSSGRSRAWPTGATPTPARSTSSTPPAASWTGATSSSSSLNTGDTAEALVTALRDHIRGQVNSGVPDQFFQVLECDAADAGDVFARVLAPVLAHLAARMPAMDADAIAGTRAELRATAQRIGTLDRRRGAGAGVGRAVVGQRGRGPRPAVAAAAPGPVGGARRAGRRAARAGPGGRGGPGVHRRRRARLRRHPRVDHGRARDRRAGVARRGAAQHDGRPQQQPLRRRRAEPGPGGDQQLLRGDRRLLRRAGAGAVGAGRRHRAQHHTASCWARSRTRRRATRRCAASSRCSPSASEPCPRLRRAVEQLLSVRLDYRSQLHPGCARSWTG